MCCLQLCPSLLALQWHKSHGLGVAQIFWAEGHDVRHGPIQKETNQKACERIRNSCIQYAACRPPNGEQSCTQLTCLGVVWCVIKNCCKGMGFDLLGTQQSAAGGCNKTAIPLGFDTFEELQLRGSKCWPCWRR